ncbi:SseB family protein [Actinomadura fulvescens]|uniref:SseB protein N-terminal domain-containing protein n=1 Tax=Actinomadura fulvescens TaxID=46160 RepID=A0ABN3PJ05_9ACTN
MDWNDFAKRLAIELMRLPVQSFLILQKPGGLPYVQVMRTQDALDAEAVSSAFLSKPLNARQERLLTDLDWRPPNDRDRHNWWHRASVADRAGRPLDDLSATCEHLAGRMAAAFRDVHAVRSPLDLVYQASRSGPDGGPLALPGLGIPLAIPEDEDVPDADLETSLAEARDRGDQRAYLDLLAGAVLCLPVPGDPSRAEHHYATAQFGDGTFVLAFTSPDAMNRSLRGQAVHHRPATLTDLARNWPRPEWQLAINPGLPSAAYLDATLLQSASPPPIQETPPPVNEVTTPSVRHSAPPPAHQAPQPPAHETSPPPVYESAPPPVHPGAPAPAHEAATAAAQGSPQQPVRENTRPPLHEKAPPTPPVHETAPPPVHQAAPPPGHETSTPPVHETSPPPVYESAPPLVRPAGPAPTHEAAPPPMHETSPPPVHQSAPPPVYESAPPLVRPGASAPAHEAAPAAAQGDTRQPGHDSTRTPLHKEASPTPPVHETAPPPVHQAAPSPVYESAPSPVRSGASAAAHEGAPAAGQGSPQQPVREGARPPLRDTTASVRESVPSAAVDPNVVVMQKVVRPEHVAHYLDGGYEWVAGYVHRLQDVAELNTPQRLVRTLGLVYEGSPFSARDEGIHVIRWPAVKPVLFRRPLGGIDEWSMGIIPGGWVIEKAPFPGSGYAPGDGPAIPEFKVDSQRLPHGAEMYRIDRSGTEALVAEYDADRRRWVRLEGGA